MSQNLACSEYNEVLHKDAAIMIIKVFLKIFALKFLLHFIFFASLLELNWNGMFLQAVLDLEKSYFPEVPE